MAELLKKPSLIKNQDLKPVAHAQRAPQVLGFYIWLRPDT